MSVRVLLPSSLRPFARQQKSLEVEGATIDAVLQAVVQAAPGLRGHLLNERGAKKPYVHAFLNGEDVRGLADGETAVRAGDVVELLAAVSGG